jgi:hypothetical protein
LKGIFLKYEEKKIVTFDEPHFLNTRVLSNTNYIIKEYGIRNIDLIVENLTDVINAESAKGFRIIGQDEIRNSLNILIGLKMFTVKENGDVYWA